MIKAGATLSIKCISLDLLQVKEYQERYPARLLHYIQQLQDYPEDYAGVLSVTPSNTHPGMYVLLDGHTRFAASIIVGRKDVLAVVIEEQKPLRKHQKR